MPAKDSSRFARSASRAGPADKTLRAREKNRMAQDKIVRIGGASGFWGDSSVGAPQLIRSGVVDYLVFDYLAELTMSLLAAARMKNASLGYATDFVTVTMRGVLREAMERKIRIV